MHGEGSVKFLTPSRRHRVGGRLAVAGLMLLLWVGTIALTVSPELHRLFHGDAQGADHNCLITQIQQHPLLAGFIAIVAPAPALTTVAFVWPTEVQVLTASDYRLSPSRAPPFPLSSRAVVG